MKHSESCCRRKPRRVTASGRRSPLGAKLLVPTPALNAASPAGDLAEQPAWAADNPREEGRQLPASLLLGSPGLPNCSDHQPVRLNILAALPPIIRDFSSSERISEWRI